MSKPFPEEWARCSPWIEAALEGHHGTHTIDDVRARIEGEHAQFWPGLKAALVTEIVVYPQKKALHFWLGGGSAKELVRHMRPAVEHWGRAQGCTLFFGLGSPTRPSWGRALLRHGYAPSWQCYMKDDAHGRHHD